MSVVGRGIRRLVWIVALLVVPNSAPALGHTLRPVDLVCPLDGTKFHAILDGSGTQFGVELDLRPIGPMPAPWTIAVCPTDHFPLYKDDLSPGEIADLRAFVQTNEYRAWAATETSYYLTAKVLDHLKADPLHVAHTLLKATWQAAGTPDQYARYAAESLQHFNTALAAMTKHDDAWVTAQLVALELERRTTRWTDAGARIAAIAKDKAMQAGRTREILDLQGRLLAAHDARRTSVTRPLSSVVQPPANDRAVLYAAPASNSPHGPASPRRSLPPR